MKRYAIDDLVRWKESHRRKPLIVEGARQVGKTWLVKEFAAQHYKNIAYVNFENEAFLRNIFETDYNVSRLLNALSAATGVEIVPGETLIFLDEIQEAKGGITSLKYFQEDAPEQHVIAAGSLLGIELHRHASFPVGKVQFLTLRPMCFREFLDAMGQEKLGEIIDSKDWAMIDAFAPRLKELLKQYYYVGGMPEAVLEFSVSQSWTEVRSIQREILQSYDLDFSKHAPAELVPRIRGLWNSLPTQLSRENRKFIYGLVKEGARAREYELALQWLMDGGLIHKVMNVTAPRILLKSYEDSGAFKLFALDLGLLGAMSGLEASTIVEGNRIFSEFKGALTEQYVLQELLLRYEPFYYAKPNSQMEIDFLVQSNGNVVPIEVKAEENLRARSLRLFVEKNESAMAYRLSMSPHREESWMTNVPLYAVSAV